MISAFLGILKIMWSLVVNSTSPSAKIWFLVRKLILFLGLLGVFFLLDCPDSAEADSARLAGTTRAAGDGASAVVVLVVLGAAPVVLVVRELKVNRLLGLCPIVIELG